MAVNRAQSDDGSSTSSTLLDRVRARRPEAWERLVDLYGPMVYRWCRRSGAKPEDAADVVQEVFLAVAIHITEFRRDRPGDSFRAWLATITRNKLRDRLRRRHGLTEARGGTDAQQRLADIPDHGVDEGSIQEPPLPPGEGWGEGHGPEDNPSIPSDPSDASWLSRRGLDLIRAEFENRTWEAFWRAAVEGQSPADIAADLGITVQAVYKAKSRVLRRLRQELT